MKRTIALICAGLLVISCNMSEDPTTDGKENSESNKTNNTEETKLPFEKFKSKLRDKTIFNEEVKKK